MYDIMSAVNIKVMRKFSRQFIVMYDFSPSTREMKRKYIQLGIFLIT